MLHSIGTPKPTFGVGHEGGVLSLEHLSLSELCKMYRCSKTARADSQAVDAGPLIACSDLLCNCIGLKLRITLRDGFNRRLWTANWSAGLFAPQTVRGNTWIDAATD
eukprot:s1438_g8.t1